MIRAILSLFRRQPTAWEAFQAEHRARLERARRWHGPTASIKREQTARIHQALRGVK